jgi:nicotinate phosphoribosyltransferase
MDILDGMASPSSWVDDKNVALLTDLYQFTMLQAYWREGSTGEATFSLFTRRLPSQRNFLLACGLADVLEYLEKLRFSSQSIEFLATLGLFDARFLDWLAELRFTGDVHAVPEGTPVFTGEPILEITAPLPEAQVVETFVMNQVHLQTVLASKAVRVVLAADRRRIVDFGVRRMHGTDAGIKAARAFYIAGVDATSNVLAGQLYGIPVAGTVAHSYIQAHDDELEAFRAFAGLYPETILLVDTYDTLKGVRKVIALAEELGSAFRVTGVRLDSGDLAGLAIETRAILDAAGLERVDIFASGGLDEYAIAKIVDRGAPILGFGVGTGMGVAFDAPALDMAYKLTSYAGQGRIKLSTGKPILPGLKQIYRQEEGSTAVRDVLAQAGEALPGRPLLVEAMKNGARQPAGEVDLDAARQRARDEIDRLPERVRGIDPAKSAYPVEISAGLQRAYESALREVEPAT